MTPTTTNETASKTGHPMILTANLSPQPNLLGRLLFGVCFVLGLAHSSQAATRSFYCNWANNNWSAATNWVPSGIPQNGDVLVFSASSPRRDCLNELSPNLACASYTLDLFGLSCPPPTLTALPAGSGKVRLFWNAIGGDGYSLQAAPVVSGATFTNLGVTPALFNGTNHATNSTTSPQQFYRLRKP